MDWNTIALSFIHKTVTSTYSKGGNYNIFFFGPTYVSIVWNLVFTNFFNIIGLCSFCEKKKKMKRSRIE